MAGIHDGKLGSRGGLAALLGALLLCLPCLLPALAVLIGVGALSGYGGWIGDNALVVSLGAAAVVVGLLTLAIALAARRRRAAVCEPPGSELDVITKTRARRIPE